MKNAKSDKKVIPAQKGGSENNAAAAPENAAGGTEIAPENPEQSGGNASQQKNTEVDKRDEKTPAGAKGFSEKDTDEAKKIFKKFSVEELYFTSDGFGFLNPKEAEYHAASLNEQKVTKINKKDVE